MISRAFKLRFRRRLRLRKLQVEELGQQAEKGLDRNFFRKFDHLTGVRRFVLTWFALVILLAGCVAAQLQGLRQYYETPTPIPGGTYTEGILGAFTGANPLYATGPADTAVSRLIFSSLLTYDANNNLVGDLAQSWSVDNLGTTYTVHLKPNLKWQDGQPLTAADVVFTYQVIQNPDAQSPLLSSWQGVTVREVNPLTVTFKLPNVLSSFVYSLTNGIIPKHILGNVQMGEMRSLPFDTTQPVGSGPFKFGSLQVSGDTVDNRQEIIGLDPSTNYYGGTPKLTRFIIHTYRTEANLIKAFQSHDVTAIAGLSSVPSEIQKDSDATFYSLPLTGAVMTFFKTSAGVLSDVNVRQALVRATDTTAIIDGLGFPTLPVREPLLQNQLGYNPNYAQAGYDLKAANALLDAQGWVVGKDGIRAKNGIPLSFNLYTPDTEDYESVANQLKSQWRAVGADVQVQAQNTSDFQLTLAEHSYDALLYGISIGLDPDVIVYWGSMYADVNAQNRLNFSEYKSTIADESLEEGRTRTDPALRVIKYQSFLQAWQADAPAVGLYQPRFLYITHGPVYGLSEHAINSTADRFDNVQNWMIREAGVTQS